MAYFPFYIDIKNKEIVVAGGGKIALKKVSKLLHFEAKITIISPAINPELEDLISKNTNIQYKKKQIEKKDLINAFAVISATNEEEINKYISSLCKELKIPVNTVDDIDNCTFIFPSIIKRNSIIISCSTSGQSPELAAALREVLEQSIPETIGELSLQLGFIRKKLKKQIATQKERSEIIHTLIEYCKSKKFKLTNEELTKLIQKIENNSLN